MDAGGILRIAVSAYITALLLCAFGSREVSASNQAAKSAPLHERQQSLRLSENAQKVLGIICEGDLKSPAKRQKIVYVSPDSLAEIAGLRDDDEIVDAQLLLDDLKLSLMRHNLPLKISVKLDAVARRKFAAQPFELKLSELATGALPVGGTRLVRERPVPVLDVNQKSEKIPVLDVNDPNNQARVLAKFQMELIVDESLSMRNKNDCPGYLSRWNWCGVQATDLAKAVAPFESGGLVITTFNGTYEVHRHAAAQDLVQLFRYPNFHWGTRLAEPLHDRLNEYFSTRNAHSKPLLLAVITDGIPVPREEPGMVVEELVQASRAMHNATEVTVVFFQVGGENRFGHNFLQYLDQNLNHEGAQYHLVHTVPFEALIQDGLAKSLALAVQTYSHKN